MRLGHVGLTATDPKSLAGFYERVFGMRVLGEAQTEQGGTMVFLSSDRQGPPDFHLMSNPAGRHVAFVVDSLSDLRRLYAEAPSRGAQVVMSLDHGPTMSFYIRDPDANTCEVYWVTGRRQGGANRPLDLTKTEEELLELIRE